MPVNRSTPEPAGDTRRTQARSRRIAAAGIASNRHHAPALTGAARTKNNGEETDYSDYYATNFTKGLQHNACGVLLQPQDYELFVDGINQESDTLGVPEGKSWFEENVPKADPTLFTTTVNGKKPDWRGWESPRSGHAYDLEGPDAESLCMAPAPRLSSPELHVEVAEVYTLALLRDVPFTKIVDGSGVVNSKTVNEIVGGIAEMDWFNGTHPPQNELENKRCMARGTPPTPNTLFRGSAPGVNEGPYISQFLLSGTNGKGATTDTGIPGTDASFNRIDGYIQYGTQVIDQRVAVHQSGVDYMTKWHAWLDVQNGASTGGTADFDTNLFLTRRRFITTPRDLATYVHFDQLYQAYFNAALMLDSVGGKFSLGFPSGERHGYSKDKRSINKGIIKRDSFATFGGPHLLALLTEVSTRALRAVRRQKFNYHRRCRPEAMGWLATIAASANASVLGLAESDAVAMKNALPDIIKDAIIAHNHTQNSTEKEATRKVKCDKPEPAWITDNLLLPMAFPEGSPMHPSYGAGHATVAGACVTILKAFHQLRDNDGNKLPYAGEIFLPIAEGTDNENDWGAALEQLTPAEVKDENNNEVELTIEGELNKLAANIAIGRNMAGVHFYTDYYDSLRLGERIAVGILQEQMSNYPDAVTMTFWDFDDNKVQIHSSADVNVMVSVGDSGAPATDAWWNCSPAESPPSQPPALVFAEKESPVNGGKTTESKKA